MLVNQLPALSCSEGQAIGAKVTLRRQRMYEFLDRLVSIALPVFVTSVESVVHAFDGNGNYSWVYEQTVFPELNPDKYLLPQEMNISFVTSAETNEDALELLEKFGMHFQAAS